MSYKEKFLLRIIVKNVVNYKLSKNLFRYYAHAWRRQFQYLPLWKKGEHTIKQPIHVYDLVSGLVAIVRDPDTAGKIYQAVGYAIYFNFSSLIFFI